MTGIGKPRGGEESKLLSHPYKAPSLIPKENEKMKKLRNRREKRERN